MAELIAVETPYGQTDAAHWYLTDREVMWACLKEMQDTQRFRWSFMCWPDAEGNWQYMIEANDYSGKQIAAGIGQHIVFIPGVSVNVYDQHFYENIRIGV